MSRSIWMWMHRLHMDGQGHFYKQVNSQTVEIIPDYVIAVVGLFDALCLCAGLVAAAIWVLR